MDTITESLSNFYNTIAEGIGDWGLKLVGGIFALIIGLWIIKLIMKAVSKAFDKSINTPRVYSPLWNDLYMLRVNCIIACSVEVCF